MLMVGANEMAVERRRSDRVLLTVPLRVQGVDLSGDRFECDAQTSDLNRHGAKMRIGRGLPSGQPLHVTNLLNRRHAPFRVTGPVAPVTAKGGDYGVFGPVSTEAEKHPSCGLECLDLKVNIWSIRFPKASGAEATEPKGLLACRLCSAVELVPLSMVEVDVLNTAGIFSRFCPSCKTVGPWGYAEQELVKGDLAGAESSSPPDPAALSARKEQRRHRRAVLQLPTLMRDYFGGVEVTRSENVSKGGICFISEKNYHIGEGLMVACPYDKKSDNIEVQAQIVSRREIGGTHRKIYGVRYRPAN